MEGKEIYVLKVVVSCQLYALQSLNSYYFGAGQ